MLAILYLLGCDASPPADTGVLQTAGSFRALTYNVHGLPDPLTNTTRPTDDRMERIAPMLQDFDLIGLQEDFTDAGHALLIGQVTHPITHWFSEPVDATRGYGSGLSVLSRTGHETDYYEEYYDACHGHLDAASDCLASKGFHVLRLRLGGAELDVYNTHHEAGGGADDNAARTVQVTQVLNAIASHSDGRAVLLMGDTNLRWSDPEDAIELQRYADAGLLDACDLAGCDDPQGRIDRFLVRDSAALRLTLTAWTHETQFVDEDGMDLSDHDALAVEVAWEVAP